MSDPIYLDTIIFSDFGCEIIQRGDEFFIRYDSGESAGSKLVTYEITKSEAKKAQRSEQDAYEVILARQQRQEN